MPTDRSGYVDPTFISHFNVNMGRCLIETTYFSKGHYEGIELADAVEGRSLAMYNDDPSNSYCLITIPGTHEIKCDKPNLDKTIEDLMR